MIDASERVCIHALGHRSSIYDGPENGYGVYPDARQRGYCTLFGVMSQFSGTNLSIKECSAT